MFPPSVLYFRYLTVFLILILCKLCTQIIAMLYILWGAFLTSHVCAFYDHSTSDISLLCLYFGDRWICFYIDVEIKRWNNNNRSTQPVRYITTSTSSYLRICRWALEPKYRRAHGEHPLPYQFPMFGLPLNRFFYFFIFFNCSFSGMEKRLVNTFQDKFSI